MRRNDMPPPPPPPRPIRPLPHPPTDFERLATIRFPLVVLLVCLHNDRSGEFSDRLQDAPFYGGIVDVLAQGLGGIRVPAFFLIGGYVFFLAMKPGLATFARKIRSRVRSLLVPLVAWNVIGLVALMLAQQVPSVARFLSPGSTWSIPVREFSAMQLIDAVFGGAHVQPFIYPLWFLHDLFVLVLLSPAIWWVIRATRGWATLGVLAGWLAGVHPVLVASDAFAFYFVGCHVALARKSLFTFDRIGPAAMLGWFLLQLASRHDLFHLQPLKPVLGVVAVLFVSGWLARRTWTARWTTRAAPYSFFIFLAHEPLLTFTRKAGFALLHPGTPPQLFATYLGEIVFVIGTLIAVFELVDRTAPGVLSFMTGGRSSRPVVGRTGQTSAVTT